MCSLIAAGAGLCEPRHQYDPILYYFSMFGSGALGI